MNAPVLHHLPEQSESALDLKDLVSLLWQKKFRIIFLAALLFVAGAYYIVNQPRIYSASSTLLLGGNSGKYSLPSGVDSFGSDAGGKMSTYIEFIRSRQFLTNVAQHFELHTYPEFGAGRPSRDEEEALNRAVTGVQSRLTLIKMGDTDLLKVTFESRSPQLAAELVNYLGPAFFEFYSDMRRRKADDATVWLNDQLSQLQRKVAVAEQNLQGYLQENRLIDVSSQIELARAEITALLNEKLLNDKVLSGVSATMQQVTDAAGDIDKLIRVPWVLQNDMVINLRNKISAQRQQFAELKKRYKEKHHKYIAAQTSLDQSLAEQRELIAKLVASLEQEYMTLTARSEALSEQIDTVKAQHSNLGQSELQLSRLRRDVDATQQLYEAFLSRLQETEILKDLGSDEEFAVLDYATEPRYPSKPQVTLLLIMLAMASGTVSAGFWLVLHIANDSQTRHRKLLRRINVPLLSEVPKLAKVKQAKDVLDKGPKNYQFSETIRTLRTAVTLSGGIKENRVIALTSVQPKDGKTSIAVSLADSLSKLDKTLLVDVDLRSPALGRAFGLDNAHAGLSDFATRRARFSDCVFRASGKDLTVMPAGQVPSEAIEQLSKPRFASILQKLSVLFDRVVLTVPPVTLFSDLLVLSKQVDGVVIVCDPDQTENAELINAVEKLRDGGAPILGVVLNRVKHKRRGATGSNDNRSRMARLLRK